MTNFSANSLSLIAETFVYSVPSSPQKTMKTTSPTTRQEVLSVSLETTFAFANPQSSTSPGFKKVSSNGLSLLSSTTTRIKFNHPGLGRPRTRVTTVKSIPFQRTPSLTVLSMPLWIRELALNPLDQKQKGKHLQRRKRRPSVFLTNLPTLLSFLSYSH